MPRRQSNPNIEQENPGKTVYNNGSNTWQPSKIPSFEESNCSWEQYCRRLLNKFVLTGISEENKVLALLDAIGEQTYAIVSDLCSPGFPEGKTLNQLLDILSKHYNPVPNKYAERVKFYAKFQSKDESIKHFSTDLKCLSKYCSFPPEWLDEALCTQFIIGVKDEQLRLNLFSIDQLTFCKAIEYASIFESNISANLNLRSNSNLSSKTEVNHEEEVMRLRLKPKSVVFRNNDKCCRCDSSNHAKENCPFLKSKCFRCGKIGHIAKSCKSKTSQNVEQAQPIENSKVDEECYKLQDNVFRFRKNKNILTIPVKLGNGNEIFQIDTGASVSLMSKSRFYNLFPGYKLQPADIYLKTYTKEKVKLLGMAKIMVTVNNSSKLANIYVVDGDFGSMFGLEWLWEFKLNWQEVFSKQSINNCLLISEIKGEPSQTKRLQQLLQSNKEIFNPGVGKINNMTVRLSIKDGSVPIYKRARPLALALVPRVSKELDRLESEGIINKVNFSNYATPIVPILKKDGSVRLCGDYKTTLNQVLNVDEYPIPNIDHLLTSIGNSKYYSKIDITQAYNQLEIHPDDRHYTTINTHKGLYMYNRLPFGISNAPAIWQRTIEMILNGIQNIAIFYDDIGIGTETAEEHFKVLELVFERFKQFGIRLNANKCSFFKNSIEYCGFKLSDQGVHTMQDKIEAIMSVKEPSNITEVRAFLGLVTFYGKFIPNLSSVAAPLNNLLKKAEKFVFSDRCKLAFQKIKTELISDRVLVHYDPNKELVLATDASPVGLGAVISHRMEDGTERPIAYASRTLTATERNYSQVDKEALSIIFGIKRFYAYLFPKVCFGHRP
jgi:hypothetical protein